MTTKKPANTRKPSDANTKAKDTAKLQALKSNATACNRAIKAMVDALDKATDKRLAACVALAEAKRACDKANVTWKTWAKESIQFSWESVRKMAPIGEAELTKAGDGLAMLNDLRDRNKEAAAKTRAKPKGSKVTHADKVERAAPVTPFQLFQSAIEKAKDTGEADNIAKAAVDRLGLVAVTPAQAQRMREAEACTPAVACRNAFVKMSAKERDEFLAWAAKTIEAEKKAKEAAATATADNLCAIPKKLRRKAA